MTRQDLLAIIACDQSDGYLKAWAKKELEKINVWNEIENAKN